MAKKKHYSKRERYSKKKRYTKKKRYSKKKRYTKKKRKKIIKRGGGQKTLREWTGIYSSMDPTVLDAETILNYTAVFSHNLYSAFLSEDPSTVVCVGQSPAFICLCMKNLPIYNPNIVNIVVIPFSRPSIVCACKASVNLFNRDDSSEGVTCPYCNKEYSVSSTDRILSDYASKLRENFDMWEWNYKAVSHSASEYIGAAMSKLPHLYEPEPEPPDIPGDLLPETKPDGYQRFIKPKVKIVDTLSRSETNSIRKAQKLLELTFPGKLEIQLYGLCSEYLIDSISPCYGLDDDIIALQFPYIDYLSTSSPRIVDSYPLSNVLNAENPLPDFAFKIQPDGWDNKGEGAYDMDMIDSVLRMARGSSDSPADDPVLPLLSYKTEDNISYDFDGVIHTLVDQASYFSRESLLTEKYLSTSAVVTCLKVNEHLFAKTFDDMHHFQSTGKNIFIVSSNVLPTGMILGVKGDNTIRLLLLMNGILIPNENIIMNILKKYNVVQKLNIKRHVDDSMKHLMKISESNPDCECVLAVPEKKEYHIWRGSAGAGLKESCNADGCTEEVIPTYFDKQDGNVFSDYFTEYFQSLDIDRAEIEQLRILFTSLSNFHIQMTLPILEIYSTSYQGSPQKKEALVWRKETDENYIINPLYLLMETWIKCNPDIKKKIILGILELPDILESPGILSGWLRFINEDSFMVAQKELLIPLLSKDMNYYHLLSKKLKLDPEIYSSLATAISMEGLPALEKNFGVNLPKTPIEFWVSEYGFPQDFKFPTTPEGTQSLLEYMKRDIPNFLFVIIFNPVFISTNGQEFTQQSEDEGFVSSVNWVGKFYNQSLIDDQKSKMNEILEITKAGIIITDNNRDKFFSLIKDRGIIPDIYEKLISAATRYWQQPESGLIDPLLDEILTMVKYAAAAAARLSQNTCKNPADLLLQAQYI